MQQLKAQMARLDMSQEAEVLEDWFSLSDQERATTLQLIRRLAAERRAKQAIERPPLRLVVAAR